MADLFDEGVGKPKTISYPAEKMTRVGKPKPPPPSFYEVLEHFIEKHDGTDRVSQEFEHLATQLRLADPEYVATIAALPKTTVQTVLQFAYRMLQHKN